MPLTQSEASLRDCPACMRLPRRLRHAVCGRVVAGDQRPGCLLSNIAQVAPACDSGDALQAGQPEWLPAEDQTKRSHHVLGQAQL